MSAVAAGTPSYDELYTNHRARILRLCRLLLGDASEAEEVTQEVFLKLHRAHADDPAGANWRPWLTAVAVNACRDRRRAGWWRWWRERGEAVDDYERFETLDPSPEQDTVNRETRERIWKAFQRLSGRQREVFALRHIEGWSTDDVAERLGMSSGSVKQHLFRAVQQMRAVLGERP